MAGAIGIRADEEVQSTMRHFGRLLLVTLVQGVLFLVPIAIATVLAREGYQMLRRLARPVARLLPADRVLGFLAEDLISVVAIALGFLSAGLFVGTRPGRHRAPATALSAPSSTGCRGTFWCEGRWAASRA